MLLSKLVIMPVCKRFLVVSSKPLISSTISITLYRLHMLSFLLNTSKSYAMFPFFHHACFFKAFFQDLKNFVALRVARHFAPVQ